jgi:hypothetical protein
MTCTVTAVPAPDDIVPVTTTSPDEGVTSAFTVMAADAAAIGVAARLPTSNARDSSSIVNLNLLISSLSFRVEPVPSQHNLIVSASIGQVKGILFGRKEIYTLFDAALRDSSVAVTIATKPSIRTSSALTNGFVLHESTVTFDQSASAIASISIIASDE